MVALIIFWASLCCLIFLTLGSVCKVLASAFQAFLSSIALILTIVFVAGAGALILWILNDIIDGIITKGLLSVLSTIAILVFVIVVIVCLVGNVGAILLELAAEIGLYIMAALSFVLEGAASLCEKAYTHFLLVITNRLERC